MSRRTQVGESGEPWLTPLDSNGKPLPRARKGCRWRASVWVRDRDGKRRKVEATAAGKEAALRALERRLTARRPDGWLGVDSNMTLRQLGAYWHSHRKQGSAVPQKGQRRGGPIAPQTLATYRSTLDNAVYPVLGDLRLHEVTVGILDSVLVEMEHRGRSSAQARTVLSQMLGLAVRHGAISSNPMRDVSRPRRVVTEVEALNVPEAREVLALLAAHRKGHALDRQGRRTGGRRRNPDLYELVVFLLATGTRIGEALAVTWRDLHDLSGDRPTVDINATVVEPRKAPDTRDDEGRVLEVGERYVAGLHHQELTKGREDRTLILPDAAVRMLTERRKRTRWHRPTDPVFSSRVGSLLWPNNQRTRLRAALKGTKYEGTTPHTFRRTVGTLLVHEAGLDVARDVLGHNDSSVTFQHYTAARPIAPDVRDHLDRFFDAA